MRSSSDVRTCSGPTMDPSRWSMLVGSMTTQDRRKREHYQSKRQRSGVSIQSDVESESMILSRRPLNSWCVILSATGLVLIGCGGEPSPQTSRRVDSTTVSIRSKPAPGRPVPPKPIDEMTRAERVAFVKVLTDSGAYRCCIDPGCTTCLYEADERCRCAELVRSDDPVCGECFRGWKRGKGSVQGVDAADVRRQ